jgi:hypothetical protein
MQHFTSLQLLSLDKCGILSLPECLGNLFSHRSLQIVDCRGIKTLPENIKKLTKLEDLNIIKCPELKMRCEIKGKKEVCSHPETIIALPFKTVWAVWAERSHKVNIKYLSVRYLGAKNQIVRNIDKYGLSEVNDVLCKNICWWRKF